MADALTKVAAWRKEWIASLSDDQRAAIAADRASYSAEETKAERMGELAATFQAADTNADGLLDQAEFQDFMTKVGQNASARNVPFPAVGDVSDEIKQATFEVFNGITADSAGVSLADFGKATAAIYQKMQEL